MTDTAIHDDARDAIAYLRACINDDIESAEVIQNNCDLEGVLAIVAGMLAGWLVDEGGKDGALVLLDRMLRRNLGRSGPEAP